MSTTTLSNFNVNETVSTLKAIEINAAYDAVMYRSKITTLESELERIKGECDDYLNEVFGDQKRITTQDNEYTVIRVANNRSQYQPSFIYNLAKRFLKWAELITPKVMQPVGKGFYYKAAK